MVSLSDSGREINAELDLPPFLENNSVQKTFLTSVFPPEETENVFLRNNNHSAHVNKTKGDKGKEFSDGVLYLA